MVIPLQKQHQARKPRYNCTTELEVLVGMQLEGPEWPLGPTSLVASPRLGRLVAARGRCGSESEAPGSTWHWQIPMLHLAIPDGNQPPQKIPETPSRVMVESAAWGRISRSSWPRLLEGISQFKNKFFAPQNLKSSSRSSESESPSPSCKCAYYDTFLPGPK